MFQNYVPVKRSQNHKTSDQCYYIVFGQTISDIDDLEIVTSEQTSQFNGLSLDFYSVSCPSALIIFTDMKYEKIERLIRRCSTKIAGKITGHRVSVEKFNRYVIIAFSDDVGDGG